MVNRFADDNLALAVLQELLDAGLVPRDAVTAVREANPYDRELYWDEVMEDAEDDDDFEELCSYRWINSGVRSGLVGLLEANAELLPRVRRLRWFVPEDVMYACWANFDGESDEFDIGSFAGIERCPSLESVGVQHLTAPVDLTPLTRLPALAELDLRHAHAGQDWTPLLAVPALRRVDAPVPAPLAAELTARGVTLGRG